jgi:hypothetical protein
VQTHCDMSTENGGWTQVRTIPSSSLSLCLPCCTKPRHVPGHRLPLLSPRPEPAWLGAHRRRALRPGPAPPASQ